MDFLFYFGLTVAGVVFVLFITCFIPEVTTDIINARETVEGRMPKTDPSTWGYRDFIVNNTVIDEEFRIIEIDLRDYDLSHKKLKELRDDIFENKYPYASIVKINTKNDEYTYISPLFNAISGGDYSFPLDEFRDTIELVRINNSFTFKEPIKKKDRYKIIRGIYILTGIKETSVLGEYTQKKAIYHPWIDKYEIK